MNAQLTRRALLAAAPTVLALSCRGKPAQAQDPASPQVDMLPLTSIVPANPPKALAPVRLTTLDGLPKTLADYAGQKIVLNFWATWCIPCVAELPELDSLAATGSFAVLAVSADRSGAAAVKPFLAAHHISRLTILLDPGSDAVHALGVAGFPTTLLIGPDGRLRGTLEGPAAWGSAAPTLSRLLG